MIRHLQKYIFKKKTLRMIVGISFVYVVVTAIDRRVALCSIEIDADIMAKYLILSFYEARLTMVLFPIFLLLLVERVSFYNFVHTNSRIRLGQSYFTLLKKCELLWSFPFIILTSLNLLVHYPFKSSFELYLILIIELGKFMVVPFIVVGKKIKNPKNIIYIFAVIYFIYSFIAFQII